jgi:23S rRNA (adenine2503-C2)-methyltransferase
MDKPFRAKQIFKAVYHGFAENFSEISTLAKSFRQELDDTYSIYPATIVRKEVSRDGSEKYLFAMQDGHTVEAVLLMMKEEEVDPEGKTRRQAQYTVCLSSQIGCKVGCSFCLTAKGGFVRNLTPGEIVAQLLLIKKDHAFPPEKRLNVVYMGMGEPLDNLENVAKAITIFADEDGLAIAPRRQTISTSGISSKIKKLGELDLDIQLAISLHAVDNDLRETLIPMNKAYPIESIIDAVKNFPMRHRRRILFEYLVIKDVNDDMASAKKLVKLLDGIKAKVNLIYFNPFEGTAFKRPTQQKMVEFQEYLVRHGVLATIRQSKGLDISAACGQLRENDAKEAPKRG